MPQRASTRDQGCEKGIRSRKQEWVWHADREGTVGCELDMTRRQAEHTGLESGSMLTTDADGAFIQQGDSPPLCFVPLSLSFLFPCEEIQGTSQIHYLIPDKMSFKLNSLWSVCQSSCAHMV